MKLIILLLTEILIVLNVYSNTGGYTAAGLTMLFVLDLGNKCMLGRQDTLMTVQTKNLMGLVEEVAHNRDFLFAQQKVKLLENALIQAEEKHGIKHNKNHQERGQKEAPDYNKKRGEKIIKFPDRDNTEKERED